MDNPLVRQEDDYPLTHVFYSRTNQNKSGLLSSAPRSSFLDTFSQKNSAEINQIAYDNLTHVLPNPKNQTSID